MGLTKMTIGTFEVQVNPEKVDYNRSIDYKEEDIIGANSPAASFKNYGVEEIKFSLTFDGTGVIPAANFNPQGAATSYAAGMAGVSDPPDDVIETLEEFEEIVFDFNGEKHGPNKVDIRWGSLHIKNCFIKTYNVAFTLFSPEGKPIRAIVELGFKCIMDKVQRVREANTSSPDLTHLKTVRMGDELFIMCHEIYKSPKYYLQVAEKNNILNFRSLKAGSKLLFPPLEK
jgi:hypothetical protein